MNLGNGWILPVLVLAVLAAVALIWFMDW